MVTARVDSERLPTRRVLAELPARVVTFLRAVGTNAGVRGALALGGFGPDDEREGWALLQAACMSRNDGKEGFDPALDAPAQRAIHEIAGWVARHFPRLIAAVERQHPEASDLFAGIEAPGAARGEAVLALATLLARIDELARKRAAVVTTLSRRGLTASERARLHALVDLAQSAPSPDPERAPEQSRERELAALYRWHADWATTAHAVIERKDYLIALGLAARARRAEAALEDANDERSGST